MKAKFLIVVLAALVLATGTVWAQKGHHNRRAEHKELTTEQVAKKMTDRMKENLSLSDEQVKQVYPICLEQAQAMREHRAERREMAEKSREAMAQQREQMAGRMKAVLTPEQYAQWIECRESIAPDRHVEKAMRIPDITADPVTVLRVWIKSRQKVEIIRRYFRL